MKLVLAVAALLLTMAGCATVVSNDGERVVINWDPSAMSYDSALKAATASCREVGKTKAVEIASVQARPDIPSWMSQRRTTFRCEQEMPSATAPSTQPAQPQTPQRSNALPAAQTGHDAFSAEKAAREARCSDPKATFVAKGAGLETYSVTCSNGEAMFVRCEMGNCRVMN